MAENTSLGIILGRDLEKEYVKTLLSGLSVLFKKYSMVTISMGKEQVLIIDDEIRERLAEQGISVRIIGPYYDLGETARNNIKLLEEINGENGYLYIFLDYSLEKEFIYGVSPLLSSIAIGRFSWKDINLEQELKNRIPSSGILPFNLLVFIGGSFNEFPARMNDTRIRIYDRSIDPKKIIDDL